MISLIVINYRSFALSAQAIRSARDATSRPLQVVVVDNSGDETEVDKLRSHADIVIGAERNLGYAGGINRARTYANGTVLVVANPDVIFAPGAIDEMVQVMSDRGAAVAGPGLYWDSGAKWKLPPADLGTATDKLDEALASRLEAWSSRRDRRRFFRRVQFWSLTEPTAVRALSGAVMAIRADRFDALGGFDERFLLYFEENDFLRRVAKHGGRIVYVPSASCRHLYNQSAGPDEARTASLFVESERRYLEKWNGRLVARVLKRFERAPRTTPAQQVTGPIEVSSADSVVEASPLASFATAAGYFAAVPEAVTIPEEVWSTYRSDRLYFRVVDRLSGRVRGTYVRLRS